jgi:DNA-binding XRE family transcriptional regulator
LKKLSPEEVTLLRRELKANIHKMDISDALKTMRKIAGMTQIEYAQKILKISPRVLIDIERGVGNPTLKTLNKIGRLFGFKTGFINS